MFRCLTGRNQACFVGLAPKVPWRKGQEASFISSHGRTFQPWKGMSSPLLEAYKPDDSFFFFFFGRAALARGILVPQPGIEPMPLHWKCGVLITGPPGKFQMTAS